MKGKTNSCRYCGMPCDSRVSRCRSCMDAGLGRVSPMERLLAKVSKNKATGCWEFNGFRLPNGYGRFSITGAPMLAHRASWILHKGQIPGAMQVCHKCDNRRCVNPEHLFVGTAQENLADMRSKGRACPAKAQPKTRSLSHWKAKLTPDQVAEIRRRAKEPRKKLAAEFGTTPRYISSIITRRKRRYD